jgi:hypothetical protein
MSEWVSVLAVFWLLWAVDGVRFGPRRIFTFVGRRARITYSRLSFPGLWPGSWRMTTSDVPLSFSPAGICNRAAGSVGRPAETIPDAQAWRWEDLRDVGVARGWIFVNGRRFCADTGHVKAPELLKVARVPAAERKAALRALIKRWLRPEQSRRRAKVLRGRTARVAFLNTVSLVGFAVLTIYVVGNLAAKVPAGWDERLAKAVPYFLLTLLGLHLVAVVLAWRAVRRLKPVAANLDKRGSGLFSALLLPAQAMRLRSLAGDGYFPPQHPLAAAIAFGTRRGMDEWVFNTLADLRWPLSSDDKAKRPLADEIESWFRNALESQLLPLVRSAGISPETMLAAPKPDGKQSCSYCPRCGAQFVAGRTLCPNGVTLRPLAQR